MLQTAEVCKTDPAITMYEFRGTTLQDAVHQALRYPVLSSKKLAKLAAKFDFIACVRMGGVLFVGEGNRTFERRSIAAAWLEKREKDLAKPGALNDVRAAQ